MHFLTSAGVVEEGAGPEQLQDGNGFESSENAFNKDAATTSDKGIITCKNQKKADASQCVKVPILVERILSFLKTKVGF